MKVESKVLEKIKETDPITYQELLDLQKSRPGLFSRIVAAAVWALVGGGLGHVFADEPELGALAGGVFGSLLKYNKTKKIDAEITQTLLEEKATQSHNYQLERQPRYTPMPHSLGNVKRRNPFDGSLM